MLAVAAVFVLRRRLPDEPRAYKTWGYPLVPALFLIASLGLLTSYALGDPSTFLANLAIIGLGVPVYLLRRRYA